MKRRELKNKIRSSFREVTPDLRSDIEASCAVTDQIPASAEDSVFRPRDFGNTVLRRALACALCLLVFIAGIGAGILIPEREQKVIAESFVYLDVNPSVEISADSEGRVISFSSVNSDADKILSELELEGVELNTALTAIIGSMYVNGYLSTEQNSILVSVDTVGEDKANALLTDIKDRIGHFFASSDIKCSVITQSIEATEELKQKARENSISPGKMHFINKMIEAIDDLAEVDIGNLANMPIGDLEDLYSNENGSADDGFFNKNDALTALLGELMLGKEQLEDWNIDIEFDKKDNGRYRMLYVITIKLKGDDKQYIYKIDSRSGDIITENNEEN